MNVGGNEHDCDHVLPNAVKRLALTRSLRQQLEDITVAIAADPGRNPMLSRVQELELAVLRSERELAMLRSQMSSPSSAAR